MELKCNGVFPLAKGTYNYRVMELQNGENATYKLKCNGSKKFDLFTKINSVEATPL